MLEGRLDLEVEQTLTIRAVYGQKFPWLVLLDERWADEHVDIKLLSWHYRRAVEHIKREETDRDWSRDPDAHLGEHLMVLYARGVLAQSARKERS